MQKSVLNFQVCWCLSHAVGAGRRGLDIFSHRGRHAIEAGKELLYKA